MGSIDHPFNPAALALGADASFIGRSMDRDPKHLQTMITRAQQHKGSSFLEIYQNCNIFNDGAFEVFTETGLEIKARSPFPDTFTIELANGGYGYLPTPAQHALGGYETWLGTNRVETAASDKIVAKLLELLAEVKRGSEGRP